MPGVQKPHCRPCISRKPSWMACRVPSALAMPSMVRISAPFACTANTVQDLTELPSRSTVQAPQWLVSQPICGPVRLSCSRRKWISKVRGSTSDSTVLPFTFIAIWDLARAFPPPSAAGARFGAGERAREHHAGHFAAVMRGSAGVGGRRGDGFRGGNGFLDRRRIERRAGEDFPRLLRPQRRLGDIGEADRATRYLASAHGQDDGGRSGGVVADLALELF